MLEEVFGMKFKKTVAGDDECKRTEAGGWLALEMEDLGLALSTHLDNGGFMWTWHWMFMFTRHRQHLKIRRQG